MSAEPFVVILVMVFGCAAFIFGIMFMAVRVLAWFGQGLGGLIRPGKRVHSRAASAQQRECRRERCRRVEHRPDAKYCCQCGGPLF